MSVNLDRSRPFGDVIADILDFMRENDTAVVDLGISCPGLGEVSFSVTLNHAVDADGEVLLLGAPRPETPAAHDGATPK